jgi:zinc-ribbon domain
MYYQTTTGPVSPTANLAVNRNRLKSYGEKVYLKDKTHYEIELFNPKTTKVLAKIYLDGQPISSSGVILNPGQRVFLERWLDEPRKFLFETYEVEDSAEAKGAIQENGKVKVEFYDQFIPSTGGLTIGGSTWIYDTYSQPSFGGNTANSVYFTSNASSDLIGQNSSIITTDSFISASLETGRSEKGESSDQKFSQAYDSFNAWAGNTINMQILPESQKPVEVAEIRNYCTNCGTRHKKSSWKFCPNCGTKI